MNHKWRKGEFPQLCLNCGILRSRKRFFAINNNSRNVIQAGQNKAAGLVPGVPDMCFVLPSEKVFWIEFKFASGTLSQSQKNIHDNWTIISHQIAVVRTFEEFINII